MIIKGTPRFRFSFKSVVQIAAKAVLALAFLAYMVAFLAVVAVYLN